jgi:uncharacterized membrane protein YccC
MAKPLANFTNFMYTQYFSDGIKITLGVLLPSFIFFQFSLLEIGLTLSLGALCVSIADSPGPWLHRKNGMIYTNIFIFLTSLITISVNTNDYLLPIEIFSLCFFFSMFNVYGTRAASVGTGALLIMVLNVTPGIISLKIFEHSFLILGGGIWYFLLSTIFSKIRPYRYAQQTLGECIGEIANHLALRARFYDKSIPTEDTFKALIDQQIKVNELLDNVREALFKTRKLINESTNAGRLMIMIFVDIVDLFEQTTLINNDYETIRTRYKDQKVLNHFATIIEKLSEEIAYIGYCLIHQEKPNKHAITIEDLDALKFRLDEIEKTGVSTFVLKKILINIRNIFNRTEVMINYFEKETKELNSSASPSELSRFVDHQSFDFKIFKNNLNLQSGVFKYALRLAIVCLIGYFVGKLFALGNHSYWILLTILVIMKPGFSDTKQRNYERVIGTIIGGVLGAIILNFIKDESAKFIILILFMLITYSFIRVKYIVSVIFMTPFILILFSFINTANNSTIIASERILDTIIGSVIAIILSYLIFPHWEFTQFKDYLLKMLNANLGYLKHVILRQSLFPISDTDYRLARKEVYVHTANLAAAFQRMMNEPKRKQQNIKEVYKFVVLNHILSSHLANLSAIFKDTKGTINSDQLKLIRKSRFYLEESIAKFSPSEEENQASKIKLHIHLSEDKYVEEITNQLEMINKIAADIAKITEKII